MSPQNILVLGVKGSVVAFSRDTGDQLWTTHLKSGNFVSIASDELRVYAHTTGELFCLELSTGTIIWQNKLTGLGYGTASIYLPGQPLSPEALLEQKRAEDAATTQVATHSANNH